MFFLSAILFLLSGFLVGLAIQARFRPLPDAKALIETPERGQTQANIPHNLSVCAVASGGEPKEPVMASGGAAMEPNEGLRRLYRYLKGTGGPPEVRAQFGALDQQIIAWLDQEYPEVKG